MLQHISPKKRKTETTVEARSVRVQLIFDKKRDEREAEDLLSAADGLEGLVSRLRAAKNIPGGFCIWRCVW
jgi:hypothetical protein